MTSGFGMRYHPILHYSRKCIPASTGRAPVGTPIVAAGNGVVIKAEYTQATAAASKSSTPTATSPPTTTCPASARGIVAGVRVTQGQVVGYLGQSGLATGPHLHYEVIINGNFVDPMAIKLARTREFDGKMLAAFKKRARPHRSVDGAGAQRRRRDRRGAGADRQAQLRTTLSRVSAPGPKPSAARISRGA